MLNSVHKVNCCRQEKYKTQMCADLTNKRAIKFFDCKFFTITMERNFDDATTVEVHEHFLYTAKLSDSLSSYWSEKQDGRSLLMGDIEWLTLVVTTMPLLTQKKLFYFKKLYLKNNRTL